MSVVATSNPGVVDGAKRRSIFKPSTWKTTTTASKATGEQRAKDAVAKAGVDGPQGDAVDGLRTLDGVETGAPLSTMVKGDDKENKVQREAGLGTAYASPSALDPSPYTQASRVRDSSPPPPPAAAASAEGAAGSTSTSIPTTPDTLGRIAFFRADQANYHLSNSSPLYPVVYDGTRYPTAEHLFQSLKFLPHHPEIAAKIRRTKNPLDAMRLARSHTHLYNAGWISQGVNVRVMHHVVLAKFSQWSDLRQSLLETGEREICNVSPTDVFWGTGESHGGRGRNVLGKVLADVREVLRSNDGLGWGSGAKTM